ncbi:macro domain-containing protein [Francisella salimarina]|uniref:Thoeris protein ThsA Macro domain-containing protein n=1 Tax=Francisella salimarina TaxID=2599927 RepID=A0AAJ4NNM8_9GAMM|nr:macro domain-containing protein [Francisella salimarina]QWU99318.1 hypothetical protein KQR59_00090 [Francisella salimarina]
MKANKLKSIDFYIGKTKIMIKEGNIFNSDNRKLKIIAFNEYFDTIVDDEIISRNSINGQFIDRLDKNQKEALNEEIKLLKDGIVEENVPRDKGNNRKFKLGTSIKFNDEFIITAFTKFDDNNRAYLQMKDLLAFYMNLWDSLDALYNSKPLVIPVLGSGITRIKQYDIDDQELLEIMLWTLKISKIKFDHPSNLTIIIHSDRFNRVNLYKIKEGNYGI